MRLFVVSAIEDEVINIDIVANESKFTIFPQSSKLRLVSTPKVKINNTKE